MTKLTPAQSKKVSRVLSLAKGKVGRSGDWARAKEELIKGFDLEAPAKDLAEEVIGMVHYGLWPR